MSDLDNFIDETIETVETTADSQAEAETEVDAKAETQAEAEAQPDEVKGEEGEPPSPDEEIPKEQKGLLAAKQAEKARRQEAEKENQRLLQELAYIKGMHQVGQKPA